MLHHSTREFVDAVDNDRLAAAARRRPLLEGSDLERVVRAASAGDAAAWSTLFERFTARLRSVARAYRLGASDADDVVQTTWLRLLEHIEAVKDPDAVGAWLETTARRESLRVLRSAQRERPTDEPDLAPEPAEPVTECPVVLAQDRAALGRALERLSPRQRRLLGLLFADAAPSYEEIATTLGIPIGSIGPTRARGLARLRRDATLVAAVGGTE